MLAQLRPKVSAFPKQKHVSFYVVTTGFLLFLGIALRVFHYVYNRSLWTDEIYLTAGIAEMNFQDLLSKPLPYMQKAPIGYLLICHLFVVLFGNNELALRLYSLLTGVAALFLFVPVARHFLKPFGTLVALTLLACATPIVYHSVEAKPYGPDLFITILLLWFYVRYQQNTSSKNLWWWGIGGSIAVWLSYPSIFVLAAMGLAVGGNYLIKGDWNRIFRLVLPFGLWLVSFLLSYFLFTKEGSDAGWLVYFFYKFEGYFPLQPVSSVTWLMKKAVIFFHYPLGLTWIDELVEQTYLRRFVQRMTIVPVVLSGLGVLYFFRTNKRYLLVVGLVLLVAVVASCLKLYPFHERMIVYLAPFVILLLAAGCDYLSSKTTSLKYVSYGLTLLLLGGLLKNAAATTLTPYLLSGYKMSYYREALDYVNRKYQAGDGVYVYWNGAAGYKYYKTADALRFEAVIDPDHRYAVRNYADYFAKVDADLTSVPNKKRVWVIYSGVDMNQGDFAGQPAWYYNGHDFREGYGVTRFTQHVRQIGNVLDQYVPTDGNPNPDMRVLLMELK
ncbi:glycosyltransferase family 39 protein [uncultured Hymenobacter sp.]|uniref:glycosyltransferase family 39 protein n=1 Tax=uncultured Hymenobacter sp. TaxID=170016 RepID=UPI0035CB72A2